MDFETIITEKYASLCKEEQDYLREQLSLPVGYLQKKIIKGKEYYYLQYRVGKTVKTDYVRKSELELTEQAIERRKELEISLENIKAQKQAIETLVSRDILNVGIIRRAAIKVAEQYPEITRMSLFGSRAGMEYREDSDVDILFESSESISLIKQTEIRLRLEEELGMSVDLVHGPLTENSFLEIDKEIVLYVA